MLLLGVGLLYVWLPFGHIEYFNSGELFNRIDVIKKQMPSWYHWFMALIGTTFLTQYLGSTISNYLANRSASHRKGYLRYYFSDHVLILGGSKVVVGVLKSIALDKKMRKKEIVILTNQDAEGLWEFIMPLLTEEELKVKVKLTIYHGERNIDKELRNCQVEKASMIYIIGEDEEKEHDSINVDCWKRVRELRDEKSKTMAQCYMLLNRNASTYVFNALPVEDTWTLETTIVNRLESVAQQVLIGDEERWKEYTLDRGKIDVNSKKYVHLVVVGMTQMGYALAITAEHLCHYPNFKKDHSLRTKITIIDPNAEEEKEMVKGRYPGLFELLRSSYRWGILDNQKNSFLPDSGGLFEDFLDIEWEFIKGSVADVWVREMLNQWKEKAKNDAEILTLAFCGENAERNMAEALYLPRGFFRHVDEEKPLTESDPLIWVYQPENSALVETAHEKVGRYKNLLVFGSMTDSFDSRMDKRIAAAKRINFLYQKQSKEEKYEGMGEQEELDRMWHGLSYAKKMSNIYAANSIYTKFRSMGINEGEKVKEADVESLAMMEHARWNIEKLLVGFSALPRSERDGLNAAICGNDMTGRENARAQSDQLREKEMKHKDIAPYDKLPEDSKSFDIAIVQNLADVIEGLK